WPRAFDAETLARAANAHLPRDLAVRAARVVPDGFHARRDATGKLYRYAIWNGPQRSPLRSRRFHFESTPLDLEAMRAAARALAGRHDFASFQAAGSSVATTVRRLRRVELTGAPCDEIRVELEGDGFLRHMVRNLVGTLLEVGLGRRPADSLGEVLAARRREAAGPTAPARGLTLVRVEYGNRRDPEAFRAPAG
ncbi:MAG: tRNA pseudouridine(38-40) synthase TruA, partial [Myxococcota bacterium]|nr:tRNA pseudouridine(38-40) synthase TruA [Myxococcota bacterium]